MSVKYQKEIFANENIKLMVNISGLNPDNTVNVENFTLNLYTFKIKELELNFSEKLSIEQVRDFYNHLSQFSIIRDCSVNKTGNFIELTGEIIDLVKRIEKVDTTILREILDKIDADKKFITLIDALTDLEIDNLHAAIKQRANKISLNHLQKLLELERNGNIVSEIERYSELADYKAKQPEKIFQNWIEKNLWVLGVEYFAKHSARKIGIDTESDLIMETTDGFIDVIELKRPNCDLFSFDSSHKSYFPSTDLSKVIGQCLHYLGILDIYKTALETTRKIKVVKPRIKIITGRTDKFNDDEYKALRMLNSNLNHIQIISYDYLLKSGENIVAYYDKK